MSPPPLQALIVEFRIHDAHIVDFAAAIDENARLSRETEPGCRQFDVCRSSDEPNLFFLYELYDDEAAVQAHLHAPHFLQMSQRTAAWVRDKQVRRMQRTAP